MYNEIKVQKNSKLNNNINYIYTTFTTTKLSVTEVGDLSVAGWAWSLHGKQTRTGNCK